MRKKVSLKKIDAWHAEAHAAWHAAVTEGRIYAAEYWNGYLTALEKLGAHS